MPGKPSQALLPTAAVLLTLAGLILALVALARTPDTLARLGKKQNQLSALHRMAADDRAAALRLDPPAWSENPTDLAGLVEEVLPGVKMDLKRQETVTTGTAWNVSPVEVTIEDLGFAELGVLLTRAERASPPWRLAEVLLAPADDHTGRGRAVLIFETPERAEP